MDYSKKIYTKEIDGIIKVMSSIKITANTPVLKLKTTFIEKPNKYSYQIGENTHLEKVNGIQDEFRHSCSPNCYVNVETFEIISLKKIDINEELTINYCCFEEDLSTPFECNCNSKNCYEQIKGFKYLNREQQENLKLYLSPYLLLKYFKE